VGPGWTSLGWRLWCAGAWTGLAGAAFSAACIGSRGNVGGPLDPRFVAVHNTLSAMGMAQVGPIQEGALREGGEARTSISLPAGCVTIVAIGADGLRNLDAALLDSRGAPLAHDTTEEPQAALHVCLDAPDTVTLVVKAASGAGSWAAVTWAGGGPTASAHASAGNSPTEANGTCDAPIPLSAGVVTGSTTHGEHEYAGSCGPSDSRELVYELDVARRDRVAIEVEAHFDSVLYIRKDDCTDANAEVDCNDDAPDKTRSRIERVLEPGRYFVFVDGYGHEAGTFKMTVTMTEVLALADVCQTAPALVDGVAQTGTTSGMADDAEAICGGGAGGAEAVWRAELASRSRVRVVEHSDDMAPVVHLRRACADAASEVACGESGSTAGDATVVGVFEPGRYSVFADARDRGAAGRYTILWQTAALSGTGANNDACADATPLPGGSSGAVEGDTFFARDDVAGSCGGAGAADVVYRLDVPRKSRVVASLEGEEAPHVLVAWRRCGDRTTELACGRGLDEVVAPGPVYVAVDGESPGALGRFTMHWALHDLTGQGGACAHVPALRAGQPATLTTAGGGDNFSTACVAGDGPGSGPDRVYEFDLALRSRVRVTVTASTFDAVLAIRKGCADAPGSPPVEIACASDADRSRRTSIDRTLEAGRYWVVVDGQSPHDQGPFRLQYDVVGAGP
jgi:hypothetical protein